MVHQATLEKCDAVVAKLAELSATVSKKISKEKLKKLGVQTTKAMFKDGLLLQRIAASSHPMSKKAKMLFISKVPITDTQFRAELEEIATLSLTGKQEIKNLVFKNNVVVGDGTKKAFPRIPESFFKDARKHILSFSELSDEPMLLSTVFKRYVSTKPKEMFHEVFRKVAREVLGSSELQKKAKFCFVFGVQVSSKFLKDLKDSGVEIEINRRNQIEYLKLKDGEEYQGEPAKPNGKTGIAMDSKASKDSDDSKESKVEDVEELDSGDEEDIEDFEVVDEPESDSESRPASRASSTASSIRNLPGDLDSEDEMDSEASECHYESRPESRAATPTDFESEPSPEDVEMGSSKFQDPMDFDYVPTTPEVVQIPAPESQKSSDQEDKAQAKDDFPVPEYNVKSGPITLDDVILASEDVHWTPDGVVRSAPSLKRAQEDYERDPEYLILHDHDYATRAPEAIRAPEFLGESGPITLDDVILPSEDVHWTPNGVVRSRPVLKRAREDDMATAPKAPKHMKYN